MRKAVAAKLRAWADRLDPGDQCGPVGTVDSGLIDCGADDLLTTERPWVVMHNGQTSYNPSCDPARVQRVWARHRANMAHIMGGPQ